MRVEDSDMIYRGSVELARVYRGDHIIVWEPGSKYMRDYLTLEVVGDSPGYFVFDSSGKTIEYSVNGGEWTVFSNAVQVSPGDIVSVRGNETTYAYRSSQEEEYYDRGSRLFISGGTEYEVYGNIMSMLYGDGFYGQTELNSGNTSCFMYMFGKNIGEENHCVSAENLVLPASVLSDSCYLGMFYNSEITSAPTLPATTLADSCYDSMFLNAMSLQTAPDLPATTLADYCYKDMFGSTPITEAPELPAPMLAAFCYWGMFEFCHNLNYIKCLAYDYFDYHCTMNWVNGVASAGTFISAEGMYGWEIGVNGIPSGWTHTQQAKEEYMTLEILSGGTLDINRIYYSGVSYGVEQYIVRPGAYLYYSVNGGQWSGGTGITQINVVAGDKVRVKGSTNERYAIYSEGYLSPSFSGSTCAFNAYGNISSLLSMDNFMTSEGIAEYGYAHLFRETDIRSAKYLVLPHGAYMDRMFENAFYRCYNLTHAPVIDADYAMSWSMIKMFCDCQYVDRISCRLYSFANDALTNWLVNVAQSGTFIKRSGVEYPSGFNGIPVGWEVEEF